ncbi:MAG: SEL1-like repeat protein, partial [Eggerthellaceae bacterium]|nr:SEL1-like repeat protein [Eggerthellaceae bacterium]
MERTSPDSEALAAQRAHTSRSRGAPIEGLVLDLDQTLLDDPVRDVDYEENLGASTPAMPSPYAPYEGTRELTGLCVPYAIVSNRPERQLLRLVGEPPLHDALYPYRGGSQGVPSVSESRAKAYSGSAWGTPPPGSLPRNVFSFPTATSGGYTVRLYKPSPVGVADAVGYLQSEFMGGRSDARVVGLGNTYEDIVAYSAAGIESALALWGVPDAMRRHAAGTWNADHAFGSVEEFTDWVKANTGYCEMALSVEDSDPDKAREYFELAVNAGDNVRVSAFRLAYALHDSDPVRAIPLYEAAIGAGDGCASANNLALLVQEDDPERAIALFEQSIASGDAALAPRNLAKLIAAKDPVRAVELIERAHDAGNGGNLASDLEPMIRTGCDEAVSLYERIIVAADPKRAYDLALLVSPADSERAKRLYRQAIEAGDELNATYELGRMLMDGDPDSAEGLFRRAIDAGSEMLATNALGCVVSRSDAASAASLFERAIAAGDNYFAPVILARLLADDDPERAMSLFGLAAEAGRADLGDALKPLVVKRIPGAIELYESAVIAADGKRANDLGILVEPFDRDMARRLFQQAIAAGDERYATGNLATLLMEEEPARAMSLFERAIAAGDENFAPCNLATMVADQDPERAIGLLERSFASGDERWAGCNLGHMHLASNPDKAAELYRRAAELGETEATLGLAYLTRNVEPDQSKKLLASARKADDCAKSVVSMLKLIGCSSRASAMDVARVLISSGFREANSEIVPLAFGDAFATDGAVLLGKSPADG